MNYYNKYIKYKSKYQNLKNKKKYKFYFIHGTKDMNNLESILTSGKIKLGSEIPIEQKYLSGFENEPYIFANIYFDDLKNLKHGTEYSLIISPKILGEHDIIVNAGWGNYEIEKILSSDDSGTVDSKLKLVRKFIKNPTGLPKMLLDYPSYRLHEVKFNKPIDVQKYVKGIAIYNHDEKDFNSKVSKIKKILEKTGLTDIKVFDGNKLPSYSKVF